MFEAAKAWNVLYLRSGRWLMIRFMVVFLLLKSIRISCLSMDPSVPIKLSRFISHCFYCIYIYMYLYIHIYYKIYLFFGRYVMWQLLHVAMYNFNNYGLESMEVRIIIHPNVFCNSINGNSSIRNGGAVPYPAAFSWVYPVT